MSFVNWNGQIINKEDLDIGAGNRSFRYGDGVFETIRMSEGRLLFYMLHYSRLILGLDTLQFSIPEDFTIRYLEGLIVDLAKKKGIRNGRVRINVFRAGEGTYLPNSNHPDFVIEVDPINGRYYELNNQGLHIGVMETPLKAVDGLSNLKTNSAVTYVLAAIHAKKQGWDDCLVLNTSGHIADASSSNVFAFNGKQLITNKVSDAGVSGVMQRVIVKMSKQLGIELIRKSLTVEDLLDMEELFLTNVIQGIKWVEKFKNKTYQNNFTPMLLNKVNEKVLTEISKNKKPNQLGPNYNPN